MKFIESEMQHEKALKALAKVKELEKQKKGYKFVKVDERTKVFRKIIPNTFII